MCVCVCVCVAGGGGGGCVYPSAAIYNNSWRRQQRRRRWQRRCRCARQRWQQRARCRAARARAGAVAAMLVMQLDPGSSRVIIALLAATFGVSVVAMLIKRLVGRVRPNRPGAGKFLGPTLSHENFRESFPSSHSAAAVAMSAMLAFRYPRAAATFWTLALMCAALRYVLDAHWLSDVLGGIALGYAAAHLTQHAFGMC